MLENFRQVSKEIIVELGAEEAMSRALAYISGYTEDFKQRSLMCSLEGF